LPQFNGTNLAYGSSSSGGVNTPYFTINKGGTNQDVTAGAFTLVTWNNVVLDTSSMWTSASNGVTIQVTGKYRLSAELGETATGGWPANKNIALYKNGVVLYNQAEDNIYYGSTCITYPVTTCTSGDVFTVYFCCKDATTVISGSTNSTWFSGWKLAE